MSLLNQHVAALKANVTLKHFWSGFCCPATSEDNSCHDDDGLGVRVMFLPVFRLITWMLMSCMPSGISLITSHGIFCNLAYFVGN